MTRGRNRIAAAFAWIAISFGGLLVAYVIVLWTEWLPPISEAEKQSLALLQAEVPSVPLQENAFFDLWTIEFAMDAREIAVASTSELQRVNTELALDHEIAAFIGPADQHDPLREGASAVLCPADGHCLEHVARNLEAVDALLADSLAMRRRAHLAMSKPVLRNPFKPTLQTPLNADNIVVTLRLLQTEFAWEFLSRNKPLAIQNACAFADRLRSLRATSNSVLTTALLDRAIRNNATLYVGMLRSTEVSEQPKTSCAAWRPLGGEEFVQCDVWRTEFQWTADAADVSSSPEMQRRFVTRTLTGLGANQRHLNARLAGRLAPLCLADTNRLRLAGRLLDDGTLETGFRCSRWERPFNPIGCFLLDSSAGAPHAKYFNAVFDLEAELTLTREVEARMLVDEDTDAFLEGLRAKLPKTHPLRVSQILGTVEIPIHSRNSTWSLPLSRTAAINGARAQ